MIGDILSTETIKCTIARIATKHDPMNTVFRLTFDRCQPDLELTNFFFTTIQADVSLFQVPALPNRDRIQVTILPKELFLQPNHDHHHKGAPFRDSIAFVDSSIHVLHYSNVSSSYTKDSYLKIVRHECVHALQLLASQVHSQNAIWLYESIACAVAEQELPITETVPGWDSFTNHFYSNPGCYAFAYRFGLILLHHFTIQEIMQLSKSSANFSATCCQLYNEAFNK